MRGRIFNLQMTGMPGADDRDARWNGDAPFPLRARHGAAWRPHDRERAFCYPFPRLRRPDDRECGGDVRSK